MAADIEYSELRLKEPTAAQWADWADLNGIEADITAISRIAGVPATAVGKIGVRDVRRAAIWLQRFFLPVSTFDPVTLAYEGERTFALFAPFTDHTDVRHAEVTAREPTAADWAKWEGLTPALADIKAVSVTTGLSEPVVRQMRVRDLREIATWVGLFFVDVPETGA